MPSSTRQATPASLQLPRVLLLTLAGLLAGCGGSSNSGSSTPPPPAATTTTLSASPSSAVSGTSITLTASVTLASGAAASGTVNILDGSTSLGMPALNASGSASVTSTTLAVGVHSISATFTGSSTEATSSSIATSVTITAPVVTKTATSVSLTSSSSSVLSQGLPVELVAQVTPTSGTAIPTGSITFSVGATSLGTAALDASGRAITTVTSLAVGSNSITAAYAGDSTFANSSSSATAVAIAAVPGASTFTNPLVLNISNGTAVSCADPAILKVQTSGADTWYLYCTSDALYSGDPATHYINVFHSQDLVTWTYNGDAFAGLPSWAPNGQLWAPAIKFFNNKYYLYYTSPSSNRDANGGAAIGVGTSSNPAGPFVDSGTPVVEPALAAGTGVDRSTIDPDEVADSTGQRYVTFGSFTGGIFARKLSADGLTSDASSEVQLAATERYEGGSLWQHGAFWYLFTSSSNCCNGPLTGYSVFVGRSSSPMGPFVDPDGIDLAAVNPGGLEVLAQNGDTWIGPGGNVLFTDEAGQDYMLYHAVSSLAPTYAGTTDYTARPALIDAMEWSAAGWPSVRGGFGPSATPQPTPAAQPSATNAYKTLVQTNDAPAAAIASLSDEFNGTTLSPQWSSLHGTPAYTFANGAINLPTVSFDSCCNMAQLPILVEAAPTTDYMVETQLTMNLPVSGSNANYAQGDLFIYGDDQDFLRLDLFASDVTRQVEFNKQMTPNPSYAASAGYSNLAKPAIVNGAFSVYLRIAKRTINNVATYTAYSSIDGQTWNRGATWTHALANEKIGIAGANLAGYTASFNYIHVSTLQ